MSQISILYEKLYKSIRMMSWLISETMPKITPMKNTISTLSIVVSLLSFIAKQCSVTVKS